MSIPPISESSFYRNIMYVWMKDEPDCGICGEWHMHANGNLSGGSSLSHPLHGYIHEKWLTSAKSSYYDDSKLACANEKSHFFLLTHQNGWFFLTISYFLTSHRLFQYYTGIFWLIHHTGTVKGRLPFIKSKKCRFCMKTPLNQPNGMSVDLVFVCVFVIRTSYPHRYGGIYYMDWTK